jgi:hypothetical protein
VYERVCGEDSDIRDHLPLLQRSAHGDVLELGVRDGNSTAALLAGLEKRGGTLWSVDVDPACATQFEGHLQWRFVLSDSRDTATIGAAGVPDELDVLFVDTLHTYEQVRDELAAWGDRVRPGGLILFHDTDSFPEIRRAIAEWCRGHGVPFRYLGGSNGLGVAYPGHGRAYAALLRMERASRLLRESVRRRIVMTRRFGIRAARRVRRALRGRP